MLLIFFLLTIIAIAFFLVSALILFELTKLFKVQGATYKNSIKILLFFGVVSFLIEAFFAIFEPLISLNFLSAIIAGIIIFFVFHYFFKRYYQSSWKKSLGIYITFFVLITILSLAVAMPIRYFLVEPFYVKGDKMNPTLVENDYLLTEKFSDNYQRGDIIAFNCPQNQTKILIRRIIGLPVEKVEIVNGDILIDSEILDESKYFQSETSGNINLKLKTNEYFVLGDNRKTSLDSRIFGPVTKKDITGKVFLMIRDSKLEFVE